MKKNVIVKLPVTINIDKKRRTLSLQYGKVAPIKLDDGSKITLKFAPEVQPRNEIN